MPPLPIGAGPDPVFAKSDAGAVDGVERTECILAAFQLAIQSVPGAVAEYAGNSSPLVLEALQKFRVLMSDQESSSSSAKAILASLRLPFLADDADDADDSGDIKDVARRLRRGIETAQNASESTGVERERELDRAAGEMTRAISSLVRLILRGAIEYWERNIAAGSEEALAKLLRQLRSSQLGPPFATWVAENWKHLIGNPQLRPTQRLHSVSEEAESEPAQQKPPPKKDPKTWVVVRLIDSEGNPVPGQRYHITLSDSSVQEGTLDSDGSVRFNDILPGQCKVRFPDIHGKEWTPS